MGKAIDGRLRALEARTGRGPGDVRADDLGRFYNAFTPAERARMAAGEIDGALRGKFAEAARRLGCQPWPSCEAMGQDLARAAAEAEAWERALEEAIHGQKA